MEHGIQYIEGTPTSVTSFFYPYPFALVPKKRQAPYGIAPQYCRVLEGGERLPLVTSEL